MLIRTAASPIDTGDAETPNKIRLRSGDLMLAAARIRAEAKAWEGHRPVELELRYADRREQQARELLPEAWAERGAGGELVPHGAQQMPPADYRSTVAKPDYVAAAASRERLDLAQRAGVLEVALDAADTVQARNSIEQMLAHQIAATHASAMILNAQLNRQADRMDVTEGSANEAANVKAARLASAMSRVMSTFQQGVLALERMRSGGRQVVTVQHVNVGPGGQAVVAGNVSSGGRGSADQAGAMIENGQ